MTADAEKAEIAKDFLIWLRCADQFLLRSIISEDAVRMADSAKAYLRRVNRDDAQSLKLISIPSNQNPQKKKNI
jgi:hypothetical protein